jgi:hypothetical protein
MAGRATLTTLPSRVAMKTPTDTAENPHQGERAEPAAIEARELTRFAPMAGPVMFARP